MSEEITGKEVTAFLRQKRKASKAQKKADEEKKLATEMGDDLLARRSKGIDRMDCTLGSVTFKEQVNGQVDDWNKLHKHIMKTKDFSLLEKRLGQASFREQLEDGVKIPGVKKFTRKYVGVGFKRGVK